MAGLLSSYLESRASDAGVRLTVSSNVSPEVTLYDAGSAEPSVFDMLGIKPHVVLRTRDGQVLAEYGSASPPDYVLAGVYLVALTVAATVAAGALLKGLRAL